MSVKLFICYEMPLPDEVLDDLEQEVYESIMGEEGGDVKAAMFVEAANYSSLHKHLKLYGVPLEKVKLYMEAELKG